MTTDMKQLLALLLLGCVFVVYGDEEGGEKQDPCTQGLAAAQLFMQYRGCAGPNPYQRVKSLSKAIFSNLTVDGMTNLFTGFCGTLFPRINQCFVRNIQNCSIDQRNSLMRVVQRTGFVCQPNTNRTNRVINYLLARLTDADLAVSEACNRRDLSMVRDQCMSHALVAIGASAANISNVIRGLNMEQLAAKIRLFVRVLAGCVISQIRDRLSSECPQWRGKAIWTIKMLFLPPWLGKNMPFTEAELDRLFQWPSGAQTPMSVEQGFLLNVLK